MNPQSKEDIIRLTAQEAGVSRELVKILAEDLEKTLLFYIRNPIYAGKEIVMTVKRAVVFKLSFKLLYMNRIYRKMVKNSPNSFTVKYLREYKKKYYV